MEEVMGIDLVQGEKPSSGFDLKHHIVPKFMRFLIFLLPECLSLNTLPY